MDPDPANQEEEFIEEIIVEGNYVDEPQEMEEEEFEISNYGLDKQTDRFDSIIGALQEIVIGSDFQKQQEAFLSQYCGHFEGKEDNKLIYTEIFEKYQTTLEKLIMNELKKRVPGFSITEFGEMLESRKDQVDEELLEMLVSFSDFNTFKETMLAFKYDKEIRAADDEEKEGILAINVTKSIIHTEEQEDGVEMPDLELTIHSLTSPNKKNSKTAKKPDPGMSLKPMKMKP